VGLQNHVRNKVVAGLIATIPVAVTAFILWYIDTKARALFGVRYPFLGIAITLGAIYLLGLFITSLLGRFVLGLTDGLLRRIPGLRDLYRSWKQIALTSEGHEGIFAHVVLIPDETRRLKMVGFTSGETIDGDPSLCCVFVPASPNPTSGRLYFARKEDCLRLEMTAQDALKLLISGGNYVPSAIGRATARAAITTANPA
jgi:uncharacterized membrane protein